MFKNKKSNLKGVGAQAQEQADQQHEEPARREELESGKLTPAEIIARVREIRRYLETFKDGLEGVPFDAIAESPGNSIRDIDYRSIRDPWSTSTRS